MLEVELLATGERDYRRHDPDGLRAWMRDRKRRDFVDRTTIAAEAVRRLVAAGVECLAPSGPRALGILRDEIDPARTIIGRTAKS
jgi:hypothetical protein